MASSKRIVPLVPPMILAGALLAGCAGSVLGTNGSTTSGGGGESGASSSGSTSAGDGGGGAAPNCEALEQAAEQQVDAVVQQNLACSVDADCMLLLVGSAGLCAAPCGLLSDVSGAQAVVNAAASACQPFLAAGCKPPLLECPAFPPFLCAGGTCSTYAVSVTPSPLPPLTHGVCTALRLDYLATAPDAPHPIAILAQSANGTVYADTACTTPVTTGTPTMTGTLTIPAGSTGVDFGFMPAAAGGGFLAVGPGIGGGEYSFTAQ